MQSVLLKKMLNASVPTLVRGRRACQVKPSPWFALLPALGFAQMAFAQSYSTGTSLLQSLAQAIFVSYGPYIFMIALGVLVIMVGKGWASMKTAAIAAVACFVFFMVPSIVRYLASLASSQI